MHIRPQVIGDTDRVWDLLADAFADGGRAARLAEALLDGPSRIALVAEDDEGEIVGHLQLSRSWLDSDQQLVDDVLVLSPVAVSPHRQRQGVGRELLVAALAAAEQRRAPLVWLEGDPTYYPEFGFARGGERGFRPPSGRISTESFLVSTLSAWEPWMVGSLVYPDVFWQHDAVGPQRHTPD